MTRFPPDGVLCPAPDSFVDAFPPPAISAPTFSVTTVRIFADAFTLTTLPCLGFTSLATLPTPDALPAFVTGARGASEGLADGLTEGLADDGLLVIFATAFGAAFLDFDLSAGAAVGSFWAGASFMAAAAAMLSRFWAGLMAL